MMSIILSVIIIYLIYSNANILYHYFTLIGHYFEVITKQKYQQLHWSSQVVPGGKNFGFLLMNAKMPGSVHCAYR